MTPDCRNDCVEPLQFPKRPKNRPGLSHIVYRIGRYADFRDALLRNLDKTATLAAWTHREADDPGIALLEGVSILGDILTFYQELYANEAYLRTAQWRDSVADLVRLLGYRLSPGVGGRATFAFGMTGTQPIVVPKGFPLKAQVKGLEQPTDFETIAALVAEPALSEFHLYRPFVHQPITAQTKTFAVETATLKQLKLEQGDRMMLVANPSDPNTQRQIAVIEEVHENLDLTEITIAGSWQGADISEVSAYKLGRSFRYFGYNAPPTVTVVNDNKAQQNDVDFTVRVGESIIIYVSPNSALNQSIRSTSNFLTQLSNSSVARSQVADVNALLLTSSISINPPLPNVRSFPLDSEENDLSPGSTLLVSLQLISDLASVDEPFFFERQITRVTSASMTVGALTGGTTVVELNKNVSAGSFLNPLIYTDLRSVEFQEVIGNKLTLKTVRTAKPTSDLAQLFYYGDGASYQKLEQRSIQLTDGNHVETVVANIDPDSIGDGHITLRSLVLNPQLQSFTLDDFPFNNPSVIVYGNLVDATQGKTEKEEILGNGDSRQIFQTFQLSKSPLTYLTSASDTPPEVPQLEIWVNDRQWQRVPSFFGHQPKEEIYIVREDANGESWVQFGDGKTGARLPSGVQNVVAKYRTGVGANGALKEDTTVQPDDRLDRLDKIWLPDRASGGSQPEAGNHAKEAAPGKIQSLGRLVSLKDFETETLAIAGVAKVAAAWELVDNVPAVVLTVLMQTGRAKEIEQVRSTLNHYNRCRGSQRFPIVVQAGALQFVYLDITVGSDPTFRDDRVKQAIANALGVLEDDDLDKPKGLFSLHQRQFGQKEYTTRIEGIVQNVEGVVWVDVTAFGLMNVDLIDPLKLTFPAEPKPLNTVMACSTDRILSLQKPHLYLNVVATVSKEEC
jgi:hypothetical protein